MGQKICPLSFFNFYVNKEAAQAGGCHMCVEENCALWDEHFEQCSLKSGIEAVGTIADALSGSNEAVSQNTKASSPISNILERMRLKKKVPDAKAEPSIVSQLLNPTLSPGPTPTPTPAPAPVLTISSIPAAPASTTSAPPTTVPPPPPVASNYDLLNPPNVPITELPVISLGEANEKGPL